MSSSLSQCPALINMDLKARQEQLNSQLAPLYQRYFACINNLAQAHALDREHEYACFDQDMQECVKAHDMARRDRFPIARTRDKVFRSCTKDCALYLQKGEIPEPHTEADIQDLEKYVNCMQPCLLQITHSMIEEIASLQRSTSTITSQYPLSS